MNDVDEPKKRSGEDFILDPGAVQLRRTARGDMVMELEGREYVDPKVRRAFPLEESEGYIGFFATDGDEIGMLETLEGLDAGSRQVLLEELEKVYFRPEITAFDKLTEEFGTVRAQVQTSNGARTIQIRGIRSNIRLLSGYRATIEDVEGNRYLLKEWNRLPKNTREILGL
jgi:hypothetical protein